MQHAAQHAVSLDRGTASGVARAPSSFLWAAVDLPFLALEALHIGVNEYAVVTEPSRRGEIVHQASENARSVGIKPGMNVNAALAIWASLQVCPRDPDAERRYLHEFHHWAGRFTPTVSTEPPTTLLFEVAASLKLFDGVEALYDRLRRELDQTGHRCYLALTPTPGASSMLAAAGRETLITDRADLRMSMQALPIHSLGLAGETLRRLRAAGVSSLEELWRLPRHDLARRFGPDVVRKLDQALGMRPDPRRIDAIPDCFERHRELEAETVEAGFILQAARFLLKQFSDFLTARSAVASEVQVWLKHAGKPATRIDVGTRLPMRDAGQWERLLREHIQRRELCAPVRGIRLSGSGLRSINPASGDLFETPDAVGDWARALDELEARLGKKNLWMPKVLADHRPEHAWKRSPPAVDQADVSCPPHRPLWLLDEPRRLNCQANDVSGSGSFNIIDGPERIESGWWDDNEYCRDYYTVVCSQGRRLWVFQDLKKKSEWYLHGLFG